MKSLWPLAEVKVFGSFASNLSLPTSDIDISITHEAHDLISMIHALGGSLEKDGGFGHIEKITRARVPLIKFRDLATGVSIDASFNSANGPRNTEIVKRFIQEYPASRPLTLVVKHFLYHNCLNEPYYGGLGAYGLFLMVVSFLQHHAPGGDPAATRDEDLGPLLVEFFRLYGTLFNYCTTGISVRNGGSYFSKILRRWFEPEKPYMLSIEDPEDTENDVTKQAFDIMTIRSLFAEAYTLLNVRLKSKRSYKNSVLSEIIAVHPKLQEYRSKIRAQYTKVIDLDDNDNDGTDGDDSHGGHSSRGRDRGRGSSGPRHHRYFNDDDDDDDAGSENDGSSDGKEGSRSDVSDSFGDSDGSDSDCDVYNSGGKGNGGCRAYRGFKRNHRSSSSSSSSSSRSYQRHRKNGSHNNNSNGGQRQRQPQTSPPPYQQTKYKKKKILRG